MKRLLCAMLCATMFACGAPKQVTTMPLKKEMCDLKVDYGTCLDKLQVGVAVNCTPTITLLNPPVPCEQLGIMGAQTKIK